MRWFYDENVERNEEGGGEEDVPIHPLNVSPFSQNCFVSGSLIISSLLNQLRHTAYPLLFGLSSYPRTRVLARLRTPSLPTTTSASTLVPSSNSIPAACSFSQYFSTRCPSLIS